MSKKERRRTRVSSTIDKLPDDIKGQLDAKLTDTANTYEELSAWLKEQGYEISKSAIGRYAIRSNRAAQRVAETLQRTQAIAQAVEAHPDLDYTKAASMVLMDGLMQRVSTAENVGLSLFGVEPRDTRLQLGPQLEQQHGLESEREHRFPPRLVGLFVRYGHGSTDESLQTSRER